MVAAAGASTDPLIGAAPNAIAVGSYWGGFRPHITAPTGTLSDATPVISSAAALLVHAAGSTQFAANPQTIKAVLLAGATKAGFNGTWTHTQTQPLDQTFGAGTLNINNSHLILTAGRKAASNSATVAGTGWDFSTVNSGTSTRSYFFDMPAGTSNTLSAALTWHRVVDQSVNASMADLNLRLYQADSNFNLVGSPIDQSISATDNVEHIWMTNGLPAGRYAWRVELSGPGSAEYALAWQTVQLVPVPEPASVLAVASAVFALGTRLRRKACRRSVVST